MATRKITGIDALNSHLFETIEGLKNNSDPEAEPKERMDIETARTIAGIGKVIIDGYKVKAQVLSMYSKSDNPNGFKKAAVEGGFIEEVKELPETT